MADYRDVLEKLARDGIAERMPSGAVEQERAWLEVCLRHARRQVCIYTQTLSSDALTHEQVLNELTKFLARPEAILKVLVQSTSSGEDPFIERVSSPDMLGVVIIRNARGSYGRPTAKRFSVMDENGYRFETDAEKGIAVAAFNEPETAKHLLNRFNEAFELAKDNEVYQSGVLRSSQEHEPPQSLARDAQQHGFEQEPGERRTREHSNVACG